MNHLDHESFAKRALAVSNECLLLDRVSANPQCVTPRHFQTWALLVFFLTSFVWNAIVLRGQVTDAKPEDVDTVVVEDVELAVADFAFAQDELKDPQVRLLRSYMHVHAALARRACELTEVEEKQLAEMNDGWLLRQMREAASSPVQNAAAGVAKLLLGRAAGVVAPRREQPQVIVERVREAVDKHIDAALTDEQRIAFHTEREARDEFRNESLVRVLIAALDARVFLSSKQRQQLETELDGWLKKDLYWQVYFQNQNFVPDIPKETLTKVLTPEQMDCLKGVRAWLYELAQIELQMAPQEPIMIER